MKKFKPHIYLFLTIIFWGSSFPIISFLLKIFPPIELALSRFFIPAMFAISYVVLFKKIVNKEDVTKLFFSGLAGVFAFTCFINLGLEKMSVGAGSFIVNCNPLITTLIGVIFLKEKVKTYFWIGICICVVGIFIISFENNERYDFNFGIIYFLFAAASVSIYFHLIKPLVVKYGTMTVFCYTIIFGTLPMLAWLSETFYLILDQSLDIKLSVLWLTLLSTLIPYYTWTHALGHFGANKASFFLFLIPVIAIMIDFIIYRNYPNFLTIVAGVIILGTILRIMFLNYKEK